MRFPVTGCALSCVLFAAPAAAQSVRVSERVEVLEARARQDSLDPAAHYNVAMGYLSRNRFDQADSALQRSVALDPQFAIAWLALAVVQDRNRNHWRALERTGDSAVHRELELRDGYYRRAFLIDPNVDIRILGSVFRFNGYGGAIQALVEGDYERAYQGMQVLTAIFQAPTFRLTGGRDSLPEALLWLYTLAAARANHVPEAVVTAERLLERSQTAERSDTTRMAPLRTNEYRYMLAALRHRAGERDVAAGLYRTVIENDLGNYMAHVQLARLAEASSDWTTAIAERQAAIDASPEDHTLHLDLGVTLARAGRWDEAEAALVQSRTHNPRDPRTWYRLGIVQQQLGKTADARQALEHFVAAAPSRYGAAVADARRRLQSLP